MVYLWYWIDLGQSETEYHRQSGTSANRTRNTVTATTTNKATSATSTTTNSFHSPECGKFCKANKNSTGQVIGDIDCATKKYIDSNDVQYINVACKKVILYIDEPLVELNAINTQKINELKEMGIEIVNNLDELKGFLE